MIPVYLSYFDTNTDFWSPSALAKNKYILLFTLMLPYSLGPKLNGSFPTDYQWGSAGSQ